MHGDDGAYEYGNCRFITHKENMAEAPRRKSPPVGVGSHALSELLKDPDWKQVWIDKIKEGKRKKRELEVI